MEGDHLSPVTVRIGESGLSFEQLVALSGSGARVQIEPSVLDRLRANHAKFVAGIKGRRRMYGVNTGFADNRDSPLLAPNQMSELQENLIRSHAAGHGKLISREVVRAAMVIRAASLARGYSGVRAEVVEKLAELYNSGLQPDIPCFGSVGASGDLSPLSHLALALIGEAPPQLAGDPAWSGFAPLTYDSSELGESAVGRKLGPKEGLALNNGTAFMTAWLSLSVYHAENLLAHSRLALAMTLEALFGLTHPFSAHVQDLRGHATLTEEARELLEVLAGSKCVRWPNGGERTRASEMMRPDDVQDDYSLRCALVGHGAARAAIEHARKVVDVELRAVTDNPLVFAEDEWTENPVQSGPHFHGAILALPADYLRCAITELASISERRTAKLVDKDRNYGLPNYLARKGGIESGLMIAQYCAASIVNDLKTKCMPYGVDTIPTGNNSEDYVSMGANACRATYEALDSAYGVVAIELISAARALNLRLKGGYSAWVTDVDVKRKVEVPAVPESDLGPKTNAARIRLTEALALGDLDEKGDVVLTDKIATCVELIKSGTLV